MTVEIRERLNRVMPAVTIRSKSGCGGLGTIRLLQVHSKFRSIFQIRFCLSHTHTYIPFQFNLDLITP